MAKTKYYVVWVGREPGIYPNWAECAEQVNGFSGAKYKAFETEAQAKEAFGLGWEQFIGKSTPLSLPPEVIADSIEVVAGGMNHDGLLAFAGCDKNLPGCAMAMARLNVPSVLVYGGSILPGVSESGSDIDIVSIFEAVGQYQAGQIDERAVHKIECEACPGAGACGSRRWLGASVPMPANSR